MRIRRKPAPAVRRPAVGDLVELGGTVYRVTACGMRYLRATDDKGRAALIPLQLLAEQMPLEPFQPGEQNTSRPQFANEKYLEEHQ